MVFLVLAILLAGFICLMLYMAIITDSLLGGSDFPSSKPAIEKVAEILKSRNGIFYDLGSARGDFLFKLMKQAPQIEYCGLDKSLLRTLVAKFKAWFSGKKITFLHKNIFDANLSPADIVYVYLPKELMPDLQTKLQKELKLGAWVLTNRVSFPSWKPAASYDLAKSEKLFVYVKD